MTPAPAIILVNFLCADQISEKAEFYRAHDLDVVVADNSGEYCGPGEVVRTDGNIGFGAACNAAASRVREAQALCFHNPDVEADIELILEIAERLQGLGGGVVAPALQTPSGRIENGYGYPSLIREAKTIVKPAPSPSAATASEPEDPSKGERLRQLRSIGSRRFASAALIMCDSGAFNHVKGFDERYALYGEDLDLWHRIGLAGFNQVFANDLTAHHAQGGGSPTARSTRESLRWAGIEMFAQLHYRGMSWQRFRRLHRLALNRRQERGQVEQILDTRWRAGDDPVTVSSSLRSAFREGIMVAASTSRPPQRGLAK